MHIGSCDYLPAAFTLDIMARGQKPKVFFREWRKHRDLSQEQAAERMEFTQETLSRLERGKIAFTGESLAAMAEAYGCDIPDLFKSPTTPLSELERVLAKLDLRQQARAVRILRAIADEEAA